MWGGNTLFSALILPSNTTYSLRSQLSPIDGAHSLFPLVQRPRFELVKKDECARFASIAFVLIRLVDDEEKGFLLGGHFPEKQMLQSNDGSFDLIRRSPLTPQHVLLVLTLKSMIVCQLMKEAIKRGFFCTRSCWVKALEGGVGS